MGSTASAKRIIASVCEEFQLSESDLRGRTNLARIVLPRHIAAYLLRNDARQRHFRFQGKPALTLNMIARLLSLPGDPCRHHTSIRNSILLVERLLADPVSGARFEKVIERIRARYLQGASAKTSQTQSPGRDLALRTLDILESQNKQPV